MNRRECLEAAGASVISKGASYGSPEDNFTTIADMLSAAGFTCRGAPIAPHEVAIMMIIVKLARQLNASKPDNWVDICGYGACGAETDEQAPTTH